MPPRIFISVDFPAPLTPTTPTISPAFASKETLSSARTPGNVFDISDILSLVASLAIFVHLSGAQDVETDDGHQNGPLDDDRHERRYAEQIEGVAQYRDEQEPEHRA